MSNPEVHKGSGEHNVEVQGAAGERIAELLKQHEQAGERNHENKHERVESARHEAHEIISKDHSKEAQSGGEPTFSGVQKATKAQKKSVYKQTLKQVRSELSAPSRAFSKVIHAPIVEKTSDIIGGSFARPDAILAGSSTALVLVTFTYVVARIFGYHLSGFETIGSFILGWIIGIIYDYVRVMMLGRRS